MAKGAAKGLPSIKSASSTVYNPGKRPTPKAVAMAATKPKKKITAVK